VRLFAIAVITCIAARVAHAQQAPPHKEITAARAHGRITIDGVLDDPTWRAATWTSDFLEKEPDEGAQPAHKTEVAIAFDDDALYVAARMWSDGPDDVDAGLTRRDDGTQAERIIISVDPFRTRHVAYSFAVSAGGTKIDWVHTDDDEHERDYSWDPVWDAKVQLLADGWSAEMRIPLGQLRYPRDATTWGVDFNRYIPHRQEDIFWIVVPKDVHAWASWFGELRGLALTPARHLELIPYVTLGADLLEAPTPPLEQTARLRTGAGGDVRIGLGPGLNLIATVNPDFAQVEADPAIVNLTAYEIALPELRPFFIEGSQIFASGHGYFYSRRIGGLPSLDLTYDQLQPPSSARILGAVKLTGELAPRTNVGAIAAVTGDETAPLVLGGVQSTVAVAPTTAWGIARIERELDDAGGTAGATITEVARALDDPTLAAQLSRNATTGGADVRLRPAHGRYELWLHAGGSALEGSPAAMTRIQEDSTHYFQRPDQPHVHLDPDATSLYGWHVDGGASKRDGEWLWSTELKAESPGLDLNDAGLIGSVDNLDWNAEGTRQETTPSAHLHSWDLSAGGDGGWNFGAIRKPGDAWTDAAFTFANYMATSVTLDLHYPGLLDDLTRGGPLMRDGAGASGTWNLSSTPNRPTVWSTSVEAGWSETGPRGVTASGSLTSILTHRLRVQLTPRALWQTVGNQYVTQIAGAGGADTYGTRYLFAHLAQHELAAELRAQLALTPDLALDVYAEPFASVGRYTGLGELSAPRTSDVRRYTDFDRPGDGTITVRDGGYTFSLADPDFTTVSLRSTVVLRWEIRPGSILYAVWQENRGRTDAYADPSYRVLGRPFTVPGEHVVALKLTWWFAP
jgi:hypothetical protein